MGLNRSYVRSVATGLFALSIWGSIAWAGSHTWRINEVFSNSDGSVQFIELIETCISGGETGLAGHQVRSVANIVNLSSLSPGTSADKTLLFGTANLTTYGGPAPDYIIPANFFSLTGDTLQYTPYHSCNVTTGSVPTNGTSSLNRAAGCLTASCPLTVALNSPKNFAGVSSPVTAPTCIDNDDDGYGNPGDATCPNGSATDCNDAVASINPGASENCGDGADNDCDTFPDCDDSDCDLNPPCVPTVSQWGMAVLTTLLLTAGTVVMNRRSGHRIPSL